MFSQCSWEYHVADRTPGQKIACVVLTFNVLDTLLCKLLPGVLQSRVSPQKTPTETGQVCNAQWIVDVAPSILVHHALSHSVPCWKASLCFSASAVVLAYLHLWSSKLCLSRRVIYLWATPVVVLVFMQPLSAPKSPPYIYSYWPHLLNLIRLLW